jgi:hypothetical protein
MRLICRNGMKAPVATHEFQQTHSQPYQLELLQHAVDASIDGTDEVQERLQAAQKKELVGGRDEIRLLMHETIGEYLDTPVANIPLSIEQETNGSDQVSLYDAFQSMTRALTHHTPDDTPQYKVDEGFEKANVLLETGSNQLPDAEELGQTYIASRANTLLEDPDAEEYWDGEQEDLRGLMETHGLTS